MIVRTKPLMDWPEPTLKVNLEEGTIYAEGLLIFQRKHRHCPDYDCEFKQAVEVLESLTDELEEYEGFIFLNGHYEVPTTSYDNARWFLQHAPSFIKSFKKQRAIKAATMLVQADEKIREAFHELEDTFCWSASDCSFEVEAIDSALHAIRSAIYPEEPTQLKAQRAQDARVWREVADVLFDTGECLSLLIEERGDDAQQLDSTFQRTTKAYIRLRNLLEHTQLQT